MRWWLPRLNQPRVAGNAEIQCTMLLPPSLSQHEREREREFTPFQPHRADAGAARTSPGRYHNRVFNHCVKEQKSLPKSILTKAVGNEEQLQNMHIPTFVEKATHDASAMEANQRSICHNAVQHL